MILSSWTQGKSDLNTVKGAKSDAAANLTFILHKFIGT